MANKLRHVPGAVDVRVQQPGNYPTVEVNVDRTLGGLVGLTQSDVAFSLLADLYGSFQFAPNFWLNYGNGVEYQVAAQVPQYRLQTMSDLANLPITGQAKPQILGALSKFKFGASDAVVSHFDVQPEVDVLLSVQDRDLGAVAGDVHRVLAATKSEVPRGGQICFAARSSPWRRPIASLGSA